MNCCVILWGLFNFWQGFLTCSIYHLPWVFLDKVGTPLSCAYGFFLVEAPTCLNEEPDKSQRILLLSLANTPKELGAISQNNFKELANLMKSPYQPSQVDTQGMGRGTKKMKRTLLQRSCSS